MSWVCQGPREHELFDDLANDVEPRSASRAMKPPEPHRSLIRGPRRPRPTVRSNGGVREHEHAPHRRQARLHNAITK